MGSSFQCRLCGHVSDPPGLSLGRLPVCNRFTTDGDAGTPVELDIIECEACQLIQLRDAPPSDALVPQVSWISYREPEGHLDALVEAVLGFSGNAKSALGTGPFEQPLLSRLAARGLSTAALELDVQPSENRYPYLESWQAMLNPASLAAAAARHGTFDVVSCRYIIEHTPAPVTSLKALKSVLAPGGLLLVEVPDSSTFLRAHDYCFLWEEHTSYFVEDTLRRVAAAAGYRVRAILRYPGTLEDALIGIFEAAPEPSGTIPAQGPSSLFRGYRDGFQPAREAVRARLLAAAGPEGDGVALFGIGHQAIMFANAFGLADSIALAVDDDPNKTGFFPPGFRSPVVTSARLLTDDRIKICLFAVAPHIQAKLHDKLAPLRARGVEFRSIYAALGNFLLKDTV